jgi:hypothetical protein
MLGMKVKNFSQKIGVWYGARIRRLGATSLFEVEMRES